MALCASGAVLQQFISDGSESTASSRRRAAVMGVAATVALVAPFIEFHRRHTTVDPRAGAAPEGLVVAGANAYSRNPMYLGMGGLLAANAVRRRSLEAWVPVIGFVTWMDQRQIPMEEAVLQARFGQSYARYCARVPRWVGFIPRDPAGVRN